MPQGVIDLLEAVEIEKEQGHPIVLPKTARRPRQFLVEGDAVGKAREHVVARLHPR